MASKSLDTYSVCPTWTEEITGAKYQRLGAINQKYGNSHHGAESAISTKQNACLCWNLIKKLVVCLSVTHSRTSTSDSILEEVRDRKQCGYCGKLIAMIVCSLTCNSTAPPPKLRPPKLQERRAVGFPYFSCFKFSWHTINFFWVCNVLSLGQCAAWCMLFWPKCDDCTSNSTPNANFCLCDDPLHV